MRNQNIQSSVNRIGFYAALSTTLLTAFTFVIAVLTPPPAGPYCKDACFTYPYLDTISRFPRDFYWMFPAIFLLAAYVILMICIHNFTAQEKKIYTQIGLFFAEFSAMVLIADYFIQLSVVQPSLVSGESDGFAMLSQYNPHGLFIALEDIGYFSMAVAFLFMAPAFSGDRLKTAVRRIFFASFILTTLSFIYYTVQYGIFREYRFEVAAITINWMALISAGAVLSIIFKRAKN